MVDVTLTTEGVEELEKMNCAMGNQEDYENRLTKKEAITLNNLLDKLRG